MTESMPLDIKNSTEPLPVPENVTLKVMSMVTNLYESGYGLTVLHTPQDEEDLKDYAGQDFDKYVELLLTTLRDGLLGVFESNRRHVSPEFKDKSIKDKFLHFARRERTGIVMGNIIGRDVGVENGKSILGYWHGPISVLYDISDKNEVLPGPVENQGPDSFDRKSKITKTNEIWASMSNHYHNINWKIFSLEEISAMVELGILNKDSNTDFNKFKEIIHLNHSQLVGLGINIEDLEKKLESCQGFGDIFKTPHSDEGFVMGRRIAPRKVRGIILSYYIDYNKRDIDSDKIYKVVATLRKISEEKGKDIYMPIYDDHGNLLWPKKMDNEEIKKFVQDRKID